MSGGYLTSTYQGLSARGSISDDVQTVRLQVQIPDTDTAYVAHSQRLH